MKQTPLDYFWPKEHTVFASPLDFDRYSEVFSERTSQGEINPIQGYIQQNWASTLSEAIFQSISEGYLMPSSWNLTWKMNQKDPIFDSMNWRQPDELALLVSIFFLLSWFVWRSIWDAYFGEPAWLGGKWGEVGAGRGREVPARWDERLVDCYLGLWCSL